ncbi:hypothetical protein GJ496_001941 [Pomphorhynchus laevis]|nr:hypothetical protein GJ496_001941 [Pomphorhynchus laevis]
MSGGLSHEYSEAVSHLSQGSQDVWKAIQKCDHDQSADIVAYVSKFIAVNKSNVISSRQVNESFQRINQDAHDEKRQQLIRRLRQQENERVEHSILETIQELNINNAQMSSHDENHQLNSSSMLLLGFARLYSGCIHPGQSLYMLWPRYNPSIVDESTTELETNRKFDHATKIHVKQVYLMMGRDFYPVPHVYAGNIFGKHLINDQFEAFDNVMKKCYGEPSDAYVSEIQRLTRFSNIDGAIIVKQFLISYFPLHVSR